MILRVPIIFRCPNIGLYLFYSVFILIHHCMLKRYRSKATTKRTTMTFSLNSVQTTKGLLKQLSHCCRLYLRTPLKSPFFSPIGVMFSDTLAHTSKERQNEGTKRDQTIQFEILYDVTVKIYIHSWGRGQKIYPLPIPLYVAIFHLFV